MKISKNWLLIPLFVLAIVALLPASPLIQHTPPRDSGIFLYISSRLLKGDVLYQTIWDDKPPMIFLINAMGLWLSGGSRWGVWILQVFGILAALWMAFSILKKAFGNTAAFLGIVSGLAILLLTLHGGNYTEEYAIPFQFAGLFFFVLAERKGGFWPAFACGLALGILFFLRQDFIGVGVAIAIYLAMRALIIRTWLPLRQLAFTLLGAIGISMVFLVYLVQQGTLAQFWDSVFLFSFAYSNLGLLEHLKAFGETLQFFYQIPLLLLSLPVWAFLLFLLLLHGTGTIIKILRNQWTGWALLAGGILFLAAGLGANILPGSRPGMGLLQQTAIVLGVILTGLAILQLFGFLARVTLPGLQKIAYHLPLASNTIIALTVIWYPVELILVNLSGRSYLHYYMAVIPVCSMLFAFLADQIRRVLGFWKVGIGNALVVLGWAIGIILTLVYNPINAMREFYTPTKDDQVQKTVRYIDANTRPGDTVLIWGAEPVVNFLSNRASPTRYPYLYPFYTINYEVKAFSAAVLSGIQTGKPVLIIYTGDTPFINISTDQKCELPSQPLLPGMENVLKAICSRYYYVGFVENTGWKVYHIDQ